MTSGLKLILLAATVCVTALLEHGGPTMAVPISNQNRNTDNSESTLVEFCQDHIGLSYRVPCLDCEVLTLLCLEIRQEHQPTDSLAGNHENPVGLDEFNEASTPLEHAYHEDSAVNQVSELGNEEYDVLQVHSQGFEDHLQEHAQARDDLSDQFVPQNQVKFLAGHGESITLDIEEEFYQQTD